MPQDAKHRLLGRNRELEVLDGLLRDVREGRSRVLVVRGEAGIGKSALLDHVARQAGPMQVVRAAGVEAESEFTYSALQLLCAPLMPHLERLPAVQQDALRVAFGLTAGHTPEMLLVGVSVLGLFAEAATACPLVCLVDDAQWLDVMSQRILAFVGRRLDAESVALVFAERVAEAPERDAFSGLPGLVVAGLADADARALLQEALAGPADARVLDRIIAETGGNPLALLELPRGLPPAELAFGFGRPGAGSVATRVEEGFRRRVEALPADTRTLLLVAAVEPIGDELLLWRALRLLGVDAGAAAPAEAAGLIKLGGPVRFRHPLVRSAVWRSADGGTLLAVHGALAEATDAQRDPDRRAWHRAHAAVAPDEEVAVDLERMADRASARGGRVAAASFLERAAALTPEPDGRARRALAAAQAFLDAGVADRVPDLLTSAELGPLNPLQQADVSALRAKASALTSSGFGSVRPLLDAAARLAELDPAAARKTCLAAFGAAIWAGRSDEGALRRVAAAAAGLPPGRETAGVFLRALTAWALDGPTVAFPLLAQAVDALTDEADLAEMWPVVTAAVELGDLQAWLGITDRAISFARTTGTLSILATALPYRAAAVGYAGHFAEAEDLLADVTVADSAAGAATRLATTAMVSAYRGRERRALDVIESVAREGEQNSLGRLTSSAACARAVLYNGLGNYPLAMEAALQAEGFQDLAISHWTSAELVEAASRAGRPAVAARAREHLADWSRSGTPWALGAKALADALTGAPGQAEEHYREAIDCFERGALGVLVPRARLLHGEWLRRQNRRTQARDELRAAHDAAVAIGMEAFAERARRELLATGETVRKQTMGAPVLTPQEAQIARLAVAGNSNAEIAAQLFLSPRTVEWHLRKIFAKVGISSRRELEGALSARDQ